MNMLASLIQGQAVQEVATATLATDATDTRMSEKNVAKVATVAVAVPSKSWPVWCSRSCTYLEELDLPDGKVMGCVQENPDWKQQWTRLDCMKNCPKRMEKEKRRG